MISLILATIVRVCFPVLMVFSLHLLLRGHHRPGGGFIAGLLAAAAVVLVYLTHGSEHVRRGFPFNYRTVLATGLALAGGTGLAALLYGSAFLEHRLLHARIPWLGTLEVGTALAFDTGVFLVVMGMTLMVISAVGGEGRWKS